MKVERISIGGMSLKMELFICQAKNCQAFVMERYGTKLLLAIYFCWIGSRENHSAHLHFGWEETMVSGGVSHQTMLRNKNKFPGL